MRQCRVVTWRAERAQGRVNQFPEAADYPKTRPDSGGVRRLGELASDVDAGDRGAALAAQPALGALVAGGVDRVSGAGAWPTAAAASTPTATAGVRFWLGRQ